LVVLVVATWLVVGTLEELALFRDGIGGEAGFAIAMAWLYAVLLLTPCALFLTARSWRDRARLRRWERRLSLALAIVGFVPGAAVIAGLVIEPFRGH